MKTDFHIHADYSADSKIKLSELLPLAIRMGYSQIAVTEHLDLSPCEIAVYGIPSLIQYKSHIKTMRNRFPELKVLCGVEVGDFQSVKTYADSILTQMKFDLVLGSVHFIQNNVNVAVPIKHQVTPSDIADYYERNLALAETCDIDVLSHLGVYKRYLQASPDEEHCRTLIEKIMQVLVRKDIALEINYSAYRKTYQNLTPEPVYLDMYRRMGGKLVTIASDSHSLEHFGDKYDVAYKAMLDFGFEHISIK